MQPSLSSARASVKFVCVWMDGALHWRHRPHQACGRLIGLAPGLIRMDATRSHASAIPGVNHRGERLMEQLNPAPHRPLIMGTHQAVSTGHYLATVAAMRILDRGGNAVDAGVAAGLCLGVLYPDMVSVAGVAPIIFYQADRQEVTTISGLGRWPRRASTEYFREHCGGEIPRGILRTVIPAAPDAWITALELYGTMRFADVAAAAIALCEDGFPAHPLMCEIIAEHASDYAEWDSRWR